MASTSQRKRGRDDGHSTLDADIQALNRAMDTCAISPAQGAFDSASALLTAIRDSTANEEDLLDLGRSCADICKVLERGLEGRQPDELSPSMLEAIEQLTTTLGAIRKEIVGKKGKQNIPSRLFHGKDNVGAIAGWKQDLFRILQIFQTELSIRNHMILLDLRHHALASRESTHSQHQSTQASVPVGELPPPAPRACFGREEVIEKVVGMTESLEPIALIGTGGIGKTSIALTVLHHRRVEERFGGNRRFIRCDQFPASCAHFLARLSKAVGAGVENPKDMTPLRPFLSSKEMLIVLDNAESILDPQGTNHQEIFAVVEELCQFRTVCVCITSRITTVPRYCKRPQIPTLSMEAACNIFYGIYGDGGRSGTIDNLLQRLDFHALSITLLATTASENSWDYDRLAEEWGSHRAQVLRTDHNESLAATMELSLTSPTFTKLGPNARDLLGVVAFFPQGVDQNNLDWLFPTIPDRKNIFDKFCVLSLTYRSNNFITMLAPIRDYLYPRYPESSPLLCATKDHYFTRLSVYPAPGKPGHEESRWIVLEDVNAEHLVDVFLSAHVDALDVWDACFNFLEHLYQHKPRQTVLGSRIEGLPDNHLSKTECLRALSRLFGSLGNWAEQKRLLIYTLMLERERGDDFHAAVTLRNLSGANLLLGLRREGIQQAEEALETFKRLRERWEQAECLHNLARLFLDDDRLDAAEDNVLREMDLLEKTEEHPICQSHHLLGEIYRLKGERQKALHHFETALAIASPFNWQYDLFWTHYNTAKLFYGEYGFDDASTHIERAKSHTVNDAYLLARAMEMQAQIWEQQCRLEDAEPEARRALEIYERLGAAQDAKDCREFLCRIEEATTQSPVSSKSDSSGNFQDRDQGAERLTQS